MIEATEKLPGTPRRVFSMNDLTPTKQTDQWASQRQREAEANTTKTMARMRTCAICGVDDIPRGVEWKFWKDGKTVHETCYGQNDKTIPPFLLKDDEDTIVAPQQHSLVQHIIETYKPTFAAATDTELDKLINTLEVLKLEHAMRERGKVEQEIADLDAKQEQLKQKWDRWNRNVTMLLVRGVQS